MGEHLTGRGFSIAASQLSEDAHLNLVNDEAMDTIAG
jgi:hypothetical protein